MYWLPVLGQGNKRVVCELFVTVYKEDKRLEPECKSALSLSTHFFPKESFSKEVRVLIYLVAQVSHLTAGGHWE